MQRYALFAIATGITEFMGVEVRRRWYPKVYADGRDISHLVNVLRRKGLVRYKDILTESPRLELTNAGKKELFGEDLPSTVTTKDT
jgi:hypothetical protein